MPQHQPTVAFDFLERYAPGGPWALTAIIPDARPTGRLIEGEKKFRRNALETFLRQSTAGGIYYSVNPATEAGLKKLRKGGVKLSKAEIAAMAWVHIDLDPRSFPKDWETNAEYARFTAMGSEAERLSGWASEEKAAILAALKSPPDGVPTPTWIVFSGGGYQAGWRLEAKCSEGFEADGEAAREECERRTSKILQHFPLWADAKAVNIDRILRLPGTVNFPNRAKIKKGRVATLSTLVDFNDNVYSIDQFPKGPKKVSNVLTPTAAANNGQLSDHASAIVSLSDPVFFRLGDRARTVILEGEIAGEEQEDNRSGWVFYATCEMVRSGCPDDAIYRVLTNKAFGISESILEHKDPNYAARRAIASSRKYAEDPVIVSMNTKHAVAIVGGRTRVVTEKSLTGPVVEYEFQAFQDFTHWYMGDNVDAIVKDKKGNEHKVKKNRGQYWLESASHRKYEAFGFFPGSSDPRLYNTWRGFAVESIKGDCSLFLDHVRETVCNNDPEVYEYVMSWMASAVQRPDRCGRVALALQGLKGTGKSFFAQTFGHLFGRHFYEASDARRFVGQFNGQLADKVLVFMDEVQWPKIKGSDSTLKTLITGDTMPVEYKGVDVKTTGNYMHIIMASNDDAFINAGVHERRYCAVRMSKAHIQDVDHFDRIGKQMRAGGYEALLHVLMTRDIENWDVWDIPRTEVLQQQQQQNMTIYQSWWLACLQNEELVEGFGWEAYVTNGTMSHSFQQFRMTWQTKQEEVNLQAFKQFLRDNLPEGRMEVTKRGMQGYKDGKFCKFEPQRQHRCYAMNTLQACRDKFHDTYGLSPWAQALEVQDTPAPTTPKQEVL